VPMMGDRRAKLIVFLVLCSLLFSLQNIATVRASEDSWTTLTEMPTARSGLGVAVVDGKIYAIGGVGGSDTNEMYNPETNTWVSKQPMPTARSRFGITVFENKIYVMGGADANGFTDANEVYDPATDTWETKASMPAGGRAELAVNAVNGKIYAIGGFFLGIFWIPSNLTEVYDPVTDTWTTNAEMPTAVYSCTSAVVDNKIYLIENGRSVTVACLNQIYDTETDTWSIGQPIPTRAVGAAAVATTGVYAPKRIYVIGGGDLFTYDLNQIYDPATDTWTTGTAMPTPRQRLGVVAINDMIYAIGGYQIDSDARVSKNERYTPADYIPEFPSWTPLLAMLVVVMVVVVYRRSLRKQVQRRGEQ
jgi:energy-converting hydrogenase Eha subunit A